MNEQRGMTARGFQIVGRYIRMHPLPFVVAVTGAAVYAAMTVGSTIVLGRVVDRVLTGWARWPSWPSPSSGRAGS